MEALLQQVDGYCERTDLSYWSEPVNAVTNAAFLIAAIIMWQRSRGVPLARALAAILFAIGVGSYLFHTHATVWAGIADVLPIAMFSLLYIYVANRHYWRMPLWAALVATLGFLPYAAVAVPIFQTLPFFSISAQYWPLPLMILVYGLFLRARAPETSKGLLIGAGLLIISLTFRSIDEPLCAQVPLGTHFLWHILNGILLGWLIEVYRRHQLAASPP